MPLVTYEQTRPWAGKMADAVEMKMMPPWFADPRYGHFANDPSLSEEQIATIAAWAKAGAPAGDARDAPAPREWSEGWNIPQPDLVVKMPKPVRIPARGRSGIYVRDCAYAFCRGQVGADGGGAAFERGACAPCGGVYSASGFGVAAACAGGRAVYGFDVERSGGAAARRTKLPAICCWCMRRGARRTAGPDGHGEVCAGGIGPGVSDALHHERRGRER